MYKIMRMHSVRSTIENGFIHPPDQAPSSRANHMTKPTRLRLWTGLRTRETPALGSPQAGMQLFNAERPTRPQQILETTVVPIHAGIYLKIDDGQ